ncbi:MAG TPA: tetratricopeptide repeat protein [Actinokineospora sp.]|nr:tetratricopeptide repeat protein [Actinokineospora sp.]
MQGFGQMLRGFRQAGGLTQEGLAEAARLSAQAIGALERGERRFPRADTVDRLAEALGLPEEQRAELKRASSRRGQPRLVAVGPGRLPRQLPPAPGHFTGRTAEVEALVAQLTAGSGVPVVAIVGMGGVGKTAIAVEVGQRVADQFPDGLLYVDLRGFSPGRPITALAALEQLLVGVGVRAAEIPKSLAAASGLLRSVLAGRRMLLLLDNAATAQQVTPLLPGTAGCAVVVTSRVSLALLHAHVQVLAPLLMEEGLTLLRRVVGAQRVDADPVAAEALVDLCGRLPLALRIVGARLVSRPRRPLAQLVSKMADSRCRLDVLELDDVGVRASFAVSFEQLRRDSAGVDRDAARACALLALNHGPDLSTEAAARLLGVGDDSAERVLEHLADLHLVETGGPGIYRWHDLVRVYIEELVERLITPAEAAAALTRLAEFYVAAAWRAQVAMTPWSLRARWASPEWWAEGPRMDSPAEAFHWLDAHRPHLLATAEQVLRTPGVPDELVVRLSVGLFTYYHGKGHIYCWVAMTRLAVTAAENGTDPVALGLAMMDSGMATAVSDPADGAGIAQIRAGLAVLQEAESPAHVALCHLNLGELLDVAGDPYEAAHHVEQAVEIGARLGDVLCVGLDYLVLGGLYQRVGEHGKALDCYLRSATLSAQAEYPHGAARALHKLGSAHHDLGDVDEARKNLTKARDLFDQLGDTVGEAHTLTDLGRLLIDTGDLVSARFTLTQAMTLADQSQDTRTADAILDLFDRIDTAES